MTLFKLTVVDDIVTGIAFRSDPAPGLSSDFHAGVDHEARAARLAASRTEVASIIVVADPLDPELWDDTRFASWTARVGVSEARAEARRRLWDRRLGPTQLHTRANELGFPPSAGSDSDDSTYRTAVLDAMADEQEMIEILAFLDEEREQCSVEWVGDEPHDLDEAEAERRSQRRVRELVAPQPLIDRRRRYDLPPPLDSWDPRNAVQQWYFAATAAGLEYWQGGSASSGQRDTHGRWAHTFAALTAFHGVPAPTVVLRYDSANKLGLVRDCTSLLVDPVDLVGNYGIAYDLSRSLMAPFAFDARLGGVGDSRTDQQERRRARFQPDERGATGPSYSS